MDPFSVEGELVNIHNAFHQGQFQAVIDHDTSSLDPANTLSARVLQLRARIALGQQADVAAELDEEQDDPVEMAAVRALALQAVDAADTEATEKARELAQEYADNLTVQLVAGTVLANAGARDEAVALLARHQGSLDAVALLVQIHLSQNRLDLAQQEVRRARSWAQDNLLVNLAESWVGLREGGEKYQSAFYVYEELATAPGTASSRALLGQAIAELHLGRLPEAEAAMAQVLQSSPDDGDALANAVVLYTILGREKEAADVKARLQGAASEHALVRDLRAKSEAFEVAKGKYTPRFEVEGAA